MVLKIAALAAIVRFDSYTYRQGRNIQGKTKYAD